jgi:hypothetical protein
MEKLIVEVFPLLLLHVLNLKQEYVEKEKVVVLILYE